jgi:hypothetical protein
MPQNADQDPTSYHAHTATPDPAASPEENKKVFYLGDEEFSDEAARDAADAADAQSGAKRRAKSIGFRNATDASQTSAGVDAQRRRSQTGTDETGAAGAADVGARIARPKPADTTRPAPEIAQDSPLEAAKKKEAARRAAMKAQTLK